MAMELLLISSGDLEKNIQEMTFAVSVLGKVAIFLRESLEEICLERVKVKREARKCD